MTGAAVEVHRGGVNAWECDHLGHMNTRFYLVRVEQALAMLAIRLGLAATPGGDGEAIAIRAVHMRFLREVRPGTAMHVMAQVLRWGERDADLLFVLWLSAAGEISATCRLTVEWAAPSGASGPWPDSASAAAEALILPSPPEALLRSVSPDDRDTQASLARADALGLTRSGLGVIPPDACDAQGVWRLSALVGRVADSMGHLNAAHWRSVLTATAPGSPRVAGAMVELQIVHLRWPRMGAACEVRSALSGCTDRVTRATHWLLDPMTGDAWAAMRTVGVALDLDARRLIALTPEAQQAYRDASIPGLEL